MTDLLKSRNKKLFARILSCHELYLMLLPAIIIYILFRYIPMYGVLMAFKNFNPARGIVGSPWVGFLHFERFFNSFRFSLLLINTISISLYTIILSFPAPIILALLLNQIENHKFRKIVQTTVYAPHFISTVVICGMIIMFLSLRTGVINSVIRSIGGEAIHFMAIPEYFKTIYVLTDIWQTAGWASIIYLAVLTNVPVEIHESATIDGANKLQRILNIDIPSILPTITILLIMRMGSVMDVGFEKIFLLQNPLNNQASEVISTYVYKVGLLEAQYSFASAVGLFNTIINLVLLLSVNHVAKKLNQTSLW